MKSTTLVIMAAGMGSRFGGGIKQLEELKEEINKYQKNVVRLETELEDLKK